MRKVLISICCDQGGPTNRLGKHSFQISRTNFFYSSRRRWKSCTLPIAEHIPKPRKRVRSICLADFGVRTSQSLRAKYLEFFRDSCEPLVKININQKNPIGLSGKRKVKILISRLDAGINLQSWVTLIDFFTPSSAPLGLWSYFYRQSL